MLIDIKGQISYDHNEIVLAKDLINQYNNFYDLTLEQAIKELIGYEIIEYVDYTVDLGMFTEDRKIVKFIGWTKTKVIFLSKGPFTHDALLEWVPRNYE